MTPFSLNIRQKLITYRRPLTMAIVNVTPDSFFAGSRIQTHDQLCRKTQQLIELNPDIIDIGAYSTRPGAGDIPPARESDNLCLAISTIRSLGCDIPISADTFRASVASDAVSAGADIINDIAGGTLDSEMFETVARLQTPYILTHTRGTPRDMAGMTDYNDLLQDICADLAGKLARLNSLGVRDTIVDPGFGFAKTTAQNYILLRNLPQIKELLGRPILVGLSRKSMITKPLGISAEQALCPTTALHAMALDRGADILRVHDIEQAQQCITLHSLLTTSQ